MNEKVSQKSLVGIVGGGKIGLQLYRLFSNSTMTKVAFVVDLDASAPAIMAAKIDMTPAFKGIDEALASSPINFVLEVTGSDRVASILKEKLSNSDTRVIDHEVAAVLMRVIDENNLQVKNEVIHDLSLVHKQITDSAINSDKLLDEIQSMTSNLRLLSLNARIEAARIGEAGKGFAVVAQEMQVFSDSVKNLTKEMEQLNNNVRTIAGSIETSLAKLAKTDIG